MSITDNKVTNFFFDPNIKLSSKLAYAITIAFFALIANDLTSFTYNYNTNNKIDTVLKLNKLKEGTSDSTVHVFADNKMKEVINHKGFIESIYQSASINFAEKYTIDKREITNSTSSISKYGWFLLTSGGIYYFCSFLMFFIMLLTKSSDSFSQKLGQSILAFIFISSFGVLFSFICLLIPELIEGKYYLNYLLNMVIQFSPILIVYAISRRNKK